MPAKRVPAFTAPRRTQRGAAVVSLEHMMALAAEAHRSPAPLHMGGTAPARCRPMRISAEEWALLFPAWPASAAV